MLLLLTYKEKSYPVTFVTFKGWVTSLHVVLCCIIVLFIKGNEKSKAEKGAEKKAADEANKENMKGLTEYYIRRVDKQLCVFKVMRYLQVSMQNP